MPHPRAPMVELRDVSKRYGTGEQVVAAVADVSLAIGAGEFVAVVGPSGSGKSTLLNLMAGLDVPDRGDVVVSGHRLSALDDDARTLLRRRTIAVVFQFFNLLPTLTAAENVALPLLLDGVPRAQAAARARSMLHAVGLHGRHEHRPDQLSGGEMQRVAVARALVTEPMLLLADEPTGNLDSRRGEEILALMRETCAQATRTVVLVTHDARAAAIADRVVTIRDGRVDTDERRRRPMALAHAGGP